MNGAEIMVILGLIIVLVIVISHNTLNKEKKQELASIAKHDPHIINGTDVTVETFNQVKILPLYKNDTGYYVLGINQVMFYLNADSSLNPFPSYKGDPYRWERHTGSFEV